MAEHGAASVSEHVRPSLSPSARQSRGDVDRVKRRRATRADVCGFAGASVRDRCLAASEARSEGGRPSDARVPAGTRLPGGVPGVPTSRCAAEVEGVGRRGEQEAGWQAGRGSVRMWRCLV